MTINQQILNMSFGYQVPEEGQMAVDSWLCSLYSYDDKARAKIGICLARVKMLTEVVAEWSNCRQHAVTSH